MADAAPHLLRNAAMLGKDVVRWAAPRFLVYVAAAIGSAVLFLLGATIYAAFVWATSQELIQQVAPPRRGGASIGIIWTILIGFVAGLIAKFLYPGPNEPAGFILTTILGIVGAFVATFLGQALGWYRAGEGAGLIGAVVGAIIVLVFFAIVSDRISQRV